MLQDNGELLKYDFTKKNSSKKRLDKKLFDVGPQDNWKMATRNVDFTTRSLICY
jgi:hypothetical protein